MRAGYILALVLTAVAWTLAGGPAHAQSCGTTYKVKRGDSLSAIAYRAYRDGGQWSLIYYVNRKTIGRNPSRIGIGQRLRIPCQDGQTAAASSETTEAPQLRASTSVKSDVKLLTADDYRPFTDRQRAAAAPGASASPIRASVHR